MFLPKTQIKANRKKNQLCEYENEQDDRTKQLKITKVNEMKFQLIVLCMCCRSTTLLYINYMNSSPFTLYLSIYHLHMSFMFCITMGFSFHCK